MDVRRLLMNDGRKSKSDAFVFTSTSTVRLPLQRVEPHVIGGCVMSGRISFEGYAWRQFTAVSPPE